MNFSLGPTDFFDFWINIFFNFRDFYEFDLFSVDLRVLNNFIRAIGKGI